MSRFFLVNPNSDSRIQLSKKQLIWLLRNTMIAEHLDVLEIQAGEIKGDYLNGYQLRHLVEANSQ